MPGRLLLDVGPAAGGHGARGIGSYVRGMVDAIGEWTADRREQVWAVGLPGKTLAEFGERGLVAPALARRPFDVGVVLGGLAIRAAARRARAGVVHATDPHRPWLPGGTRQIVTAYDLIPLAEPAMLASWRPHDRYFYRRYLHQIAAADVVMAISHATADDLVERLGVPRDRIHVVYPVIRPGAPLTRTAPAEPTFLWVGALDMHKQPELAVRALAAFRKTERAGSLRFVGPSSAAERLALMDLAGKLGVAEHVRIDGRVPDEDLEAAYASATALLATSRVEGFGLPAVEALLRGVPVVAVGIAATRETLTGAATLTAADPDALAAAMSKPRPASHAAIKRLGDRFSAKAAGEALWATYERLLG